MGRKRKAVSVPVPPPARRSRRKLLVWLAAVTVMVVVAIGWRAQVRVAEVARHIPSRPATLAEHPLLPYLVDEAESSARRTWSAVAGLAQLGRIYHANGFLDEAAAVWSALADLEPRDPRWPYLRANIVAGYGELETALPWLRQTVALAPDYVPARLALAEALLKTGRSVEAAQAFAATLTREPANPYALLGLARLDLAARRWSEAREKLQRLTAAQPDFDPGWALLVTVLEQTGAQAAADALHDRAHSSGQRTLPDPGWMH